MVATSTYFQSPQFTINFSSTLLYLSSYVIFSSTNGYVSNSDVLNANFSVANLSAPSFPGAIWFAEDPNCQLSAKTTSGLRTNVLALSSSSSSNVPFPTTGDFTTITNGSTPALGTTVTDGNPVLTDFAGSLYAVVRVVTKSSGITFSNFSDNGLSMTLMQNTVSSPFYGTSSNITTSVASIRAYLSSTPTPAWSYISNVSNLKAIGSYDVAEIIFNIPAGVQSQDTLDATTSFVIPNISI